MEELELDIRTNKKESYGITISEKEKGACNGCCKEEPKYITDCVSNFLKHAENALAKLEKQVEEFGRRKRLKKPYKVIHGNCMRLKSSFETIRDNIEGWEPFCEKNKQHIMKVDELASELAKVACAKYVSRSRKEKISKWFKRKKEDEIEEIYLELNFGIDIAEDLISKFNVDVPSTFKGIVSFHLKSMEEQVVRYEHDVKEFKGPCVTKLYKILRYSSTKMKKKLEFIMVDWYEGWEPFCEKTKQLTRKLDELASELASRVHENGVICDICEITISSGDGRCRPSKIKKLRTVQDYIAFHLNDVVRGIVKLEPEVKAFRGPCITKASEYRIYNYCLEDCMNLKKTLEVLGKNVDGLEDLRQQINQHIIKIDELVKELCSKIHVNGRDSPNCEVKQNNVTTTTSSGQESSGGQNSEPVQDNISLQLMEFGKKIALLDSNMKAVTGPCFAKNEAYKEMQVDCNNLKKTLKKLPMLNRCREERLQRQLYIRKVDELASALASPSHGNGVLICLE